MVSYWPIESNSNETDQFPANKFAMVFVHERNRLRTRIANEFGR